VGKYITPTVAHGTLVKPFKPKFEVLQKGSKRFLMGSCHKN